MRKSFTSVVPLRALGVAVIGLGTTGMALAGTVTIYQDNFSGSAGQSLAGQAPQVDHGTSPTWTKNFSSGHNYTGKGKPAGGKGFHPFWKANGTITGSYNVGGSGALEVAGLNFRPVAGHIYTLTAKMFPRAYTPGNNSRDGFAAVGFISGSQAAGVPPFFKGQGPWMLSEFSGPPAHRNNIVQGFFGPGLTHGFTVSPYPSAPGGTLKIVLNTTKSHWAATEYYNGAQKGVWVYGGNNGTTNPTGITEAAIGVNGQSAKVTYFKLTDMTEPPLDGAVIPDPKVFDSPDIAVDVATVDNLVVATPQLAKRLHLPIKVDLRGKFKNDVSALRYLRTQLVPRMNPYLFLCLDPSILKNGAADQIIAARGMTFWVTGRLAQVDSSEIGTY